MTFYKTPELNDQVTEILNSNIKLGERALAASEDEKALIYKKYQLRRKCLNEIWRFVRHAE